MRLLGTCRVCRRPVGKREGKHSGICVLSVYHTRQNLIGRRLCEECDTIQQSPVECHHVLCDETLFPCVFALTKTATYRQRKRLKLGPNVYHLLFDPPH
jgi:hypothetical protein